MNEGRNCLHQPYFSTVPNSYSFFSYCRRKFVRTLIFCLPDLRIVISTTTTLKHGLKRFDIHLSFGRWLVTTMPQNLEACKGESPTCYYTVTFNFSKEN